MSWKREILEPKENYGEELTEEIRIKQIFGIFSKIGILRFG
jgi:hypothetical protein